MNGKPMERCLVTDKWIKNWLSERFGKGNRFKQFNRQFCRDLITDASPIIRSVVTNEIKSLFHKLPTYKEFEAKYGDRPKDIVYGSIQRMILGEILVILRDKK